MIVHGLGACAFLLFGSFDKARPVIDNPAGGARMLFAEFVRSCCRKSEAASLYIFVDGCVRVCVCLCSRCVTEHPADDRMYHDGRQCTDVAVVVLVAVAAGIVHQSMRTRLRFRQRIVWPQGVGNRQ